MDRVTFDFEANEVIFQRDGQQGVETVSDLAERKTAIMAAAGYEETDLRQMLREEGLGFLLGE